MTNALSISEQGIHIKNIDVFGVGVLSNYYPVHWNRKRTEAHISARFIPEILRDLRNVDESKLKLAPVRLQYLYMHELQRRRAMEQLMTQGPTCDPTVNEHLTLMPHQQLGREIAIYFERFCFFFDTRTGKTPLSLSIIYDDLVANPEDKWLVVCPLILIENAWLEDAKTFVPELKVVNCHAATKDKRLKAINSDAQIYITNTESFATYKEYFEKIPFTGCIVDESSDMKSPKSQQSKALVDFSQKVERFYLLSGTPAPNGEWEYFMQLRAVDYFSMPSSFTQFKERYFVNISYNPQYEKLQVRPDRRDELMAQIKKYAIYVDKEDVLQTPGRDFIEVELDMPDDLMSYYRQLKNKLCVEIGDHQITVPSAAAKLNKLNQVTSGFVIDTQAMKENKFYDEEQTEVYELSNYRFEYLYSLLDELGPEQAIIWCNYRREFEVIQKKLEGNCACVYGAVGLDAKNKAIQDFKTGKIQYLIANPASADKGLTLTNAHICIYFSLGWSYELFKQSAERIYGSITKQPKKCLYYILMAKHTIDEVLYREVLQGKQDASYAVLQHLKGGL